MVTDPLSDLVARIKNGYMAGITSIEVPHSRNKEAVAAALVKSGYLAGVKKQDKNLIIELRYDKKTPAITDIRRVSRPGVRIYSKIKNMPRVMGGIGTNIVSTPKGIMPDREARKLNVGGEVICQVW